MTSRWLRQALTLARLEARRAFFSRRALWVYLLALFPVVIFIGHGIDVKVRRERYSARGITPPALIDSVQEGEAERAVVTRLGKPISDIAFERRGRRPAIIRRLQYFDGTRTA